MNKWELWIKKISLEGKSYWIPDEKINGDEITISPYNLLFARRGAYIFVSTSGDQYYLRTINWDWFFNDQNEPIESVFYLKGTKKFADGYKITKEPKIVKEKVKSELKPKTNDIELTHKIQKWLEHIKEEGLEQQITDIKLESGEMINYSPFHFKEIKNNKIYLNTSLDAEIYLNIYMNHLLNKGIKSRLENGTNDIKVLAPLKTQKNTYRLLSERAYKKNHLTESHDLFGNVISSSTEKPSKTSTKGKGAVQHTNNVWGVDDNVGFDSINLDQYQQKALDTSITSDISIINGHAGTGKSAVVKMISNSLSKNGWIVSRLSPTGRAAQLINGKTIHKWLDPIIDEKSIGQYEIIGFAKNTFKEKECLIIDEASMIDSDIWNEITRVWENSTSIDEKKIILVGDEAQLEPVGEGTPFLDFIKNKSIPISNLKELHRTKDNEDLALFSEKTRLTGVIDYKTQSPKIKFISMNEAMKMVVDTSIQMISPKRNGQSGSLQINRQIKELIKTDHSKPDFYTAIWEQDPNSSYWNIVNDTPVHVNDKIIIVKNMWEWNITNGTTGIFLGSEKIRLYNHSTKRYSTKRNCYKFQNPESKKFFYLPATKDSRLRLELAYAITIHKSQGSEYDSLILYLNNSYVNKKMLYTGVTRAKEKIFIVSKIDKPKEDESAWEFEF